MKRPDDLLPRPAAQNVRLIALGYLDEAIADCVLVIGTSARNRRIPWQLLTARQLGPRIVAELAGRPIAVLFGREASGLTNDELQQIANCR